jgi:hypothetical protein
MAISKPVINKLKQIAVRHITVERKENEPNVNQYHEVNIANNVTN